MFSVSCHAKTIFQDESIFQCNPEKLRNFPRIFLHLPGRLLIICRGQGTRTGFQHKNESGNSRFVSTRFFIISNTFISNTRLRLGHPLAQGSYIIYIILECERTHENSGPRMRLGYFETKISENNDIWTMRPFQNDCTHSKQHF